MLKGVIFDMDGVLVINHNVHTEAFRIFFNRYGLEFKGDELDAFFGKGNNEIIPALMPSDLIKERGLQRLSEEKEQIYREIFADTIQPTPGLVDFLTDIKSHNIKCAVGSSGTAANVDFVLDKCGIADMFDTIANGDMVENAKPSPDIFLMALQLLKLDKQECLVIEDAFAGLEAANAAGIKAIALSTTFVETDLRKTTASGVYKDFTQLDYQTISALF